MQAVALIQKQYLAVMSDRSKVLNDEILSYKRSSINFAFTCVDSKYVWILNYGLFPSTTVSSLIRRCINIWQLKKMETISITASCLCKAHTFSAAVSTSSLPLPSTICHCDSCRHSTGAMYVLEATWPQPKPDVDISCLSTYRFSDNITYRFCGTCSTLMFYESQRYPEKLGTFSGVLSNIDTVVLKPTQNIYVGDTKDGGASVWFRRPNADGMEIPCRMAERDGEEVPSDWPQASNSTTGVEKAGDHSPVKLWCHCGGIKLQLHRGDYASKPEEELPWFIDPKTHKSLATFDVCDSCRLHFGFDIVNWTFASLTNITNDDHNEQDTTTKGFPNTIAELQAAVDAGDPSVGTLAYYASSADVQRYFCKVCSASVFYACNDDDRMDVVDVAIGLLEAPDGARAESFLSWDYGNNPTWSDDVKGGWRERMVERVQTEAEAFRIARGYPKSRRRLEKELGRMPSQ